MRLPELTPADLAVLRPGRRAAWVAKRAAVGGGGLGVAGGLGYGVLKVEAKLARRLIKPPALPPLADGWFGDRRSGFAALRLCVLGDSAGAGLGCDRAEETPGALLASALAEATGRRVHLRVHAVSGSVSADLEAQVDRCLREPAPDIAVISIGANDVTHLVAPDVAAVSLRAAVRQLREAGVEVVVGTCPDLGTVRPIAPPLRWVARWKSRRMADVQARVVEEEGGYAVALGELLGPEFEREAELFSSDRFHPSAAGYRLFASALLPCLREAAGLPAVDRADAEMVEMTGAVNAVKAPHALPRQRAEADRLATRFWRSLRDRLGRGGSPDAEEHPLDADDPDDAAEQGPADAATGETSSTDRTDGRVPHPTPGNA